MWSYGVKLPLGRSSADGYLMLKSIQATVKQNFKMLLLTNPGERVMDPNFGVGILSYLFENFGTNTYQQISDKIHQQTKRYMPALKILHIDFNDSGIDENRLALRIVYSVPQIGLKDLLDVTI